MEARPYIPPPVMERPAMLTWDVSLERFPTSRPVPAPRKHRIQNSSTIQPHSYQSDHNNLNNNYSYSQRPEQPFPPNPFTPVESVQSRSNWQSTQQLQQSWQAQQHYQHTQESLSFDGNYQDSTRSLYPPAQSSTHRPGSTNLQHQSPSPNNPLSDHARRATSVASPYLVHNDYNARELAYSDPYNIPQQQLEGSRAHYQEQQSQHDRAHSNGRPTPPPHYSPNDRVSAENMPSYFAISAPTALPRLSSALVHLSDYAEGHEGRQRVSDEVHTQRDLVHDPSRSIRRDDGSNHGEHEHRPLVMPTTTSERIPSTLKHSSAALALAVTLALATSPEPTLNTAHMPKVWIANEDKKVKCPTQYCSKRFMQLNGLKYHLAKGRCNSALEETRGTHYRTPEEEEEEEEEEEGQPKRIRRQGRAVEGTASERAESRSQMAKGRPFACHLTVGCGKRYKSRAGLRYHYCHSGEHGLVGQALMVDGRHPGPPLK